MHYSTKPNFKIEIKNTRDKIRPHRHRQQQQQQNDTTAALNEPQKQPQEISKLFQTLNIRENQLKGDQTPKSQISELIKNPISLTDMAKQLKLDIEHESEEIATVESEEIPANTADLIEKLDKFTSIKSQKGTIQSIDQKKEENYNAKILAYVDVCLMGDNSMINEAIETVKMLSIKEQSTTVQMKPWKRITKPDVYNKLLMYFASNSKLKDIRYFFQLMRLNDIKPNLHSYVACLLAISSTEGFNSESKLNALRLLNDVEKLVILLRLYSLIFLLKGFILRLF